MRTSTRVKTARSITILLVPKVARDLARTRKRARLSNTDIVNRAISLYDFRRPAAAPAPGEFGEGGPAALTPGWRPPGRPRRPSPLGGTL
jgi:hypothetical protein